VSERLSTPDGLVAVRGPVELGDQRGRTIGFPTANIAIEGTGVEDGVWAGWLDRADATRHAAAVSIGSRSTIYGRHGFRLLEAHVLDFDDDLYDEVVTVFLCQRLRGQKRFPSLDALKEQLQQDVAFSRQWCEGSGWQPAADDYVDLPWGVAVRVPR
jgi:riboflavin kinase/FMN adenylyltransferase